jgi:hypothetical protein
VEHVDARGALQSGLVLHRLLALLGGWCGGNGGEEGV